MSDGHVIIIGGAEDKVRDRVILSRFATLAGGRDATVVVISTASSLGELAGERYKQVLGELGVKKVRAIHAITRAQANDDTVALALRDATGIFMTGGNQLKLSGVICGTPFGEAIHAARARGAVIAGTSAGASIQSSHMVAFGVGGATPKQRMTQVAAGLGLLQDAVIDQHFDQRNRYGRLLMIVSQSPQLLGIGVDEDTAAIIEQVGEHEVLRVTGRGSVTIFDPARMVSNAHEAHRSAPLLASGVILHMLPAGAAYDLTTRTLVPQPHEVDDTEAAEIAEAGRDLRQLARDIAAGDVSPTNLRRRLARNRRRVTASPAPESSPASDGDRA